jgi:hypothetical protein
VTPSAHQPSPGVAGVGLDGTGREPNRLLALLLGVLLLGLACQDREFVGRQGAGELPARLGPVRLLHHAVATDPGRSGIGDLCLDREHVFGRAVPALGPDVCAACRVDQLGGDPHMLALTLDRAFEHVADAQLLADLTHVDGFTCVDFS